MKKTVFEFEVSTQEDFRDRDNNHHELSNDQVISLYAQGVLWMESLYKASWAIKSMAPLPQDYTSDSYWPSTTAT